MIKMIASVFGERTPRPPRRSAAEKIPREVWLKIVEDYIHGHNAQASAYAALRASCPALRETLRGIAPTAELQAYAHRLANEQSSWLNFIWSKPVVAASQSFFQKIATLERLDLSGIEPRGRCRVESGEFKLGEGWVPSGVSYRPSLSKTQRTHLKKMLESASQITFLDLSETPVQDSLSSTFAYREDVNSLRGGMPFWGSEVQFLFQGFAHLTDLTIRGDRAAVDFLVAIPFASLPLLRIDLVDNPWVEQCIPRIGRSSSVKELTVGSSEAPPAGFESSATTCWDHVDWTGFPALTVLRIRNQWFRESWANPVDWSLPNVNVLDFSHDQTDVNDPKKFNYFTDIREPMSLLRTLQLMQMTNLELILLPSSPDLASALAFPNLHFERLQKLRRVVALGVSPTDRAVSLYAAAMP